MLLTTRRSRSRQPVTGEGWVGFWESLLQHKLGLGRAEHIGSTGKGDLPIANAKNGERSKLKGLIQEG